jgi:hypothetical protein
LPACLGVGLWKFKMLIVRVTLHAVVISASSFNSSCLGKHTKGGNPTSSLRMPR